MSGVTGEDRGQPALKKQRMDGLHERVRFPCHGGSHLSREEKNELMQICERLAENGKGITACDESSGTIGKRFAKVGIENTRENRRKFRHLLFSTVDCEKFLCGAILDPETLDQKSFSRSETENKWVDDTQTLVELLVSKNIVPGVKHHLKVYVLPGTNGDTVMQGLDGLAPRLKEYYSKGARFAKWRAPFKVNLSDGCPTKLAIESNMHDLARVALISQSERLVPVVEPDVMLDGDHSLEAAISINTEIASTLYKSMLDHGVFMEGCILKVNMVNPGKQCSHSYTVKEIAEANLIVLKRTCPVAITSINFLSGGQDLDTACARLSAINQLKDRAPWNISFSWSAAIQLPILDLYHEKRFSSIDSAYTDLQRLYLEELRFASEAAKGSYSGKKSSSGNHIPILK